MPSQSRFTINGLIDTNRPVMENLEQICNSSGAWFTFDNVTGLWSVVINQPGSPVYYFNNSNIISGITVNGTGLTDLYNSVRVTYPRADIKDAEDFVQIELPQSEWNPNEVPNTLDINLPLVNNQVQAQLIGFRDLKQSRVNQVISFEADYTVLGVRAGDIISVTNSALNLNNALYRVTEVVENDDQDRGITIGITAILYDASVYNEDDLQQYTITTDNGIFSAGDIGVPGNPQITKYEIDSRPRLVIETTVPAGRVEAMEFWLTTGNSSNTYSLAGTTSAPPGSVFTVGQEVTLDIDTLNTANYFCKTRAINSTTSGPFSNVSSLISFVPTQTTDAIGADTALKDENGINIPVALALSLLLSKLTSLFGSGDGSKSLIDQLINGGMDLTQGSTLTVAAGTFTTNLNNSTAGYTTANGYVLANVLANTTNVTFTTTTTYKVLGVTIQSPAMAYDYEFIDQAGTQRTAVGISAQPPLGITLYAGTPASPGAILDSATLDWQSNTTTFNLTNVPAGNYFVQVAAFPTYALNMYWPRSLAANQWGQIYPINYTNPGSNPLKVFIQGVE